MTHVQTKKGIKIIFIALIALVVLGIIHSFIHEMILRSLITDPFSGSFSETYETIETAYDVFHIFGLLVMFLVLFGAYFIYMDSSSFSETHKQKTKMGIVFLGIWVVFSFFYFLRENADLYIITSTISGIAYAIGIYLLVIEIAPKFDKNMILIGMISIITASFFQFIDFHSYIGGGASMVLGRIGRILFIVAFVEIYFFLTRNDLGLVEKLTEGPIEKKEEDTVDIVGKEEPAKYIEGKEGHTEDIEGKEEPAEDVEGKEEPTEDIKDEEEEKDESSTLMDRILEDRTKDEVINDYAEKFNISLLHAEVLFTSGYYKIEDLSSSSIEELLIIDEINPTIARKIVNYFKD